MTGDEHYRLLERLYIRAPCNRSYEPAITVSKGAAEIRFTVGEHLFHAAGAVHGSSYFKALDDAAFFAVNSLVPDVFVLTVGFSIHLLRPVTEGEMIARGRIVSANPRLYVAESALVDHRGRELARGSGSFLSSRIRLEELDR